jgi:hypothetical protein
MTTKSAKAYTPNPAHRDPTSGHSQWSISEADELLCFANSDDRRWVGDERGWGLHDLNGSIMYVGTDRETGEQSFHAKFINTSGFGVWHGFPASRKDRPGEAIKNLSRGMKCSL